MKEEHKGYLDSDYPGGIGNKYARSLIEASLDPLVIISTQGIIVDLNEALIKITGSTREAMRGAEFAEYFTDPDLARKVGLQVFSEGYVANTKLTIKDHKLTCVLYNGSVYKDEDGKILGAVVVARDVTEQNSIQHELINAKLAAEKAALLAEEAKLKAEKATQVAEDAMKAKQQFLSNMSHEIRTPMNAIIGFTRIILKTYLTEKQREYVNAIKISGDSLIVLINDILDLAKVDAGKMNFEKVPFKLSTSVSAMLHLFDTKIQEKNLTLMESYDEAIPKVLLGDPVRLHQIMLNLVSNAVKFTSSGTIKVGVKLASEDSQQVLVSFFVTDTGIGIEEGSIESIFENFQQASTGTSRLYGGTGLGLAIVKKLVESQGGTVYVKSIFGVGSEFCFHLPFMKTNETIEVDLYSEEISIEKTSIKVLVVEDMPLNQLLIKTILDDFGFMHDIAANGRIAVDKMAEHTFDIILMDLQMPEMNGFEATEYIRNILMLKVPIIALTADVTTVDLEKCKSVGMNDYLSKPVQENLLYNKITSLVKKHRAGYIQDPEVVLPKFTNLQYLLQRTKSDPVLTMEIINLYLEEVPGLVSTIKESFIKRDWQSLYAATHKIIPSFSIMGIATGFEEMAKQIQNYAKIQEDTINIPNLVLQLENVCMQACEELKEYSKDLKIVRKYE